MKVGDTETLDIGNIKHLQGCQWTISRPYDVVFTTKPQSFSTKVTIKAINAFSAQSPCIVQCKYYYLELDPTTGRYTYSRTGYKDWTVFVNKGSDNGDNSENDGSVSDYIVGDLLKFTSKEGAYMEFQVTGTEPLNRTCELSGISKDYIGEVTIPNKVHGFLVTKIKKRACWQCIFKTVNIPFSVKIIEDQDFSHVNLYVPYGTKEKYMNTAGWNSISSRRIFEMTNSETAIRNCVVKSVIEDKGWTIDGIKVSSNMDKSFNKIKGIYIKGGKKILMK